MINVDVAIVVRVPGYCKMQTRSTRTIRVRQAEMPAYPITNWLARHTCHGI